MQNELYDKYPYLKGRINAKLIRVKIAPINKPSTHKGGSISLTLEAAKKLITKKQLMHMPIHYTKVGKELPKKHGIDNKYIEIGHIIDYGEIVGEDGIEYLEADAILHAESQKKYVDEIIANKELLGNSWELIPGIGYENNGVTNISEVDDFIGDAILDKDHTAFEGTRIVYAAKNEKKPTEEIINWEEKYNNLLVDTQNKIDLLETDLKFLREGNATAWDKYSLELEKSNMLMEILEFWKEKASEDISLY